MVESIYRSANVEGIGVTFPETQTICDGMSIGGHTVDEINAVVDLKNAWRWIFQNIEQEISVDVLKTINQIAGKYTVINAGCLRTEYDEPIRVPLRNGENYYPKLPETEEIIEDLSAICSSEDKQGAALELFCYIAKGQFFNDGNKRTATLVANMFMIQNGLGILSVPPDKILEFYNALTDFYADDNHKIDLKMFLREYCLTGSK